MTTVHDSESASLARASSAEIRPDPLSEVLRTVRLNGAVFFLVDAREPWVAVAPAGRKLAPIVFPAAQEIVSFHIMTEGTCFAEVEGQLPIRVEAGDVLLIAHGDPYALVTTPGTGNQMSVEQALVFFREMAAGRLPSIVREGGSGPARIGVVCGFLACDVAPFNPALATLPALVHLHHSDRPSGDRLDSLIEFALAESREARSGSRCVLLRLSELMFVEVIRRYLATRPDTETGWLGALRDPEIGHALARLHERPAFAWTLDMLASEVGVSRSKLADRFTHLVGQPPIQYLARWRMQLATRLLAEQSAKVGAIALEVGYESEAAFSRAFKKIVGTSPAAWRRRRGAPDAA